MKKAGYLAILFCVISSFFTISAGMQSAGGGGKIVFLNHTHNFGKIKEGAEPAYTFRFRNAGSRSITITGVHPICGCTIPKFTKKPVKPGASGKISVIYNSNDRPGPFHKSIVVSTTATPHTIKLFISGIVLPKPLKGKNVTSIGGFMFSEETIYYGNISRGKWADNTLHLLNKSAHPIRILSVKSPKNVQVIYPQFPILTGEKMHIDVDFLPGSKTALGDYNNIITFKTNDKSYPDKTIYLSAFILPKTAGHHLNGPSIKFDNYYKNLGNVLEGQNETVTFHFKNVGNKPLKILQTIPSCGCTTTVLKKHTFAPGESGSLKIMTNTWGKYGQIQKYVIVKTNAAGQPDHQLVINFNVMQHPNVDSLKTMPFKDGVVAKIFTGKCQSCHVTPGIGKKGKKLYTVSCEMCHGRAGVQRLKNLPGIELNKTFLSSINNKTLYHLIATGTPDLRKWQMMPGFLKKNGGPLTKSQVLSLVKYLKSTVNDKQ